MPAIRQHCHSASNGDDEANKTVLAVTACANTANNAIGQRPIVPGAGRAPGPYLQASPWKRQFNAEQRQHHHPSASRQTAPPSPSASSSTPQQDAVYTQYLQSHQGFCNQQQGSWAGYQTASVQQHAPSGYAAGVSATIGASQGNKTRSVYTSASAFEYNPSTPASIASVASTSSSAPTSASASTALTEYDLTSYPAPAGTLNPAHLFLPLDEIPWLSLSHTAPQPQPQPKAKATQNVNQRRQRAPVEAINTNINNTNIGMGMGKGTGGGKGKGKGIGIRMGSTVRYAPLVSSAQTNAPSRSHINAAPGIDMDSGSGSAPRYTYTPSPSVSYAPATSTATSSATSTSASHAPQSNASTRATTIPRYTPQPEPRITIPDPYSLLDKTQPVQGSMLWNTAITMNDMNSMNSMNGINGMNGMNGINGMNGAGPSFLLPSDFVSVEPVSWVPLMSELERPAPRNRDRDSDSDRERDRAPSPVQSGYIEEVESDEDESGSDDTESSSDFGPETPERRRSAAKTLPSHSRGYASIPVSVQSSAGSDYYNRARKNNHFDLHHQEKVGQHINLSNSTSEKQHQRASPAGRHDHSTSRASSSRSQSAYPKLEFQDTFTPEKGKRKYSPDNNDAAERPQKRRRSESPVEPPVEYKFKPMDGRKKQKTSTPGATKETGTTASTSTAAPARANAPRPRVAKKKGPTARASKPPPPCRHAPQPAPSNTSTIHVEYQSTFDAPGEVDEVYGNAAADGLVNDAASMEHENWAGWEDIRLTGTLEDMYQAALRSIGDFEGVWAYQGA